MKKFIFAAIISFFISSEAEISITQYNSYANLFEECDRLIFGHILLKSGFLKKHRFFGPFKDGHFPKKDKKDIKRINGKSRSYGDQSDDPMTSLVIKLFPSAGLDFNANGIGSFEFDNEDQLINFIANMFCIADYVRDDIATRVAKAREESAKEAADLLKAYGAALRKIRRAKKKEEKTDAAATKTNKTLSNIESKLDKVEKERKKEIKIDKQSIGEFIETNKWTMIVKKIINAVQTEECEYPLNYTNYIISAYAWKKLSTKENIKKLAKRISIVKFIFALRNNCEIQKIINECLQTDYQYIKKQASLQQANADSIGASSSQDSNSSDTSNLVPECAEKLKSYGLDLNSDDIKKELKSLRTKELALYREFTSDLLQDALNNPNFDLWEQLLSDISSKKLPLTSIVVNKLRLPMLVCENNKDDVTTILFEQENKCESLLLTPFSPFISIPKNITCYFESSGFPDCAEVTLKCLVAALFYNKKIASKETANDWCNSFEIDLRGFEGAPIYEFFKNNPTMINGFSFINDDRQKIRDSWGALLAARPDVKYIKNSKESGKDFEIKAGWINMLTALCNILLAPENQVQSEQTEGKEKTAEQKDLEEKVQKVVKEALEGLQKIRSNSSSSEQSDSSTSDPVQTVKNTIKKLMEIRTIRGNSELIIKDDEPAKAGAQATPEAADAPATEAADKLSFFEGLDEVHGVIKICPKEAYRTNKEKVNTLAFGTTNGHAFVNDIPIPSEVVKELPIKAEDPFSWIKTLNNEGIKIHSKIETYPKIMCINLAQEEYFWILGLGCSEFMDAVLTLFYDEDLTTTNFLKNDEYCFNLPKQHDLALIMTNGKLSANGKPDINDIKEQRKDFFRKIISRSKSASNVVFALRNLKMILLLEGRADENIDAIEPINLDNINKENDKYKIIIPSNNMEADVYYLTENEFRILLDILRDFKSVDEAKLNELDKTFFLMLIKILL